MKKDCHSRREFLGMTGIGMAGVISGGWPNVATAEARDTDADPQNADLVVHNANVYTVDDRAPKAQAFAVKNGRFMAVGSSESVKKFIGKGTQTVDSEKMTIVPGFIDCHNHAGGNILLYEVIVGNP